MRQLTQDLNKGAIVLTELPSLSVEHGAVWVRASVTLVSIGTERMLVDFGRGNLIQKALQQPDKVRQVLDKVRSDGLIQTLESVRNKLDTPLALGYCNVGVVESVGQGVQGFSVGDRVLSNGKHAEVVCVPQNLCAKIPDSVDDESAAFGVIASIALQGIRLIQPTLGESVVVTGLGLVGLIAVQLLRAHGCRVIGLDFDEAKLDLAERFGAEVVRLSRGQDPIAAAQRFSRGRGVDAVLITASTKSNEPIHQAATMCRKRGRIVLVGVVGMEMSRADFYEKELSFQVSCSYGPGRYDPEYEEKGHDYPIGYVRWTEQRNFEAVLDMMADGRLDVRPLISHRFAFEDAPQAYDLIATGNPLGVLLKYPGGDPVALMQRTVDLPPPNRPGTGSVSLAFVGAGNYASAVLVPAFARTPARLRAIASATGLSAVHVGRKHGVEQATTDAAALLTDDSVHAVVVTTRHDSHARWVVDALGSGKHVFVEKPLTITLEQLDQVRSCHAGLGKEAPILMVGFNRRYAPQVQALKRALSGRQATVSMVMTVNAGAIPASHWTQDPQVGGGRLIGEGCHFVDLLRYLAGSPISRHAVVAMAGQGPRDTWSLQLGFANGSVGTVHYFANGNRRFPKERLEVFCEGGIARIDNFRRLESVGWPGLASSRAWRQDKGQRACAAAFVQAITSGDATGLIPPTELFEVAEVCIRAAEEIGR